MDQLRTAVLVSDNVALLLEKRLENVATRVLVDVKRGAERVELELKCLEANAHLGQVRPVQTIDTIHPSRTHLRMTLLNLLNIPHSSGLFAQSGAYANELD